MLDQSVVQIRVYINQVGGLFQPNLIYNAQIL